MSETLNTVVTLDELSTTPATPEVPATPKVPGKRGRKPSADVANRRNLTAESVTNLLTSRPGEKMTVSEVTRKLQESGFETKTLWTDVYTFLQTGSHSFLSEGGTGTRVKWFSPAPVASETTPA